MSEENGLHHIPGSLVIEADGYIKIGYRVSLGAELADSTREEVMSAILQAILDGNYSEVFAEQYSVTGP